MSPVAPPSRPAHPVMHTVAASAIALAVGLPFLFVLVRVMQFYGSANVEFGFWVATRVLPVWAGASLLLGIIIGIHSSRRARRLVKTLWRAFAWSLLIGLVLVGLFFYFYAEPLRNERATRNNMPAVPLSHVLMHHLFETDEDRKLAFDPCVLTGASWYREQGGRPVLAYAFCIPDSGLFKEEVQAIDTTAHFSWSRGVTQCGPGRVLGVGNARQPDVVDVLHRLAGLPFIRRIRPAAFE